MNPPHKTPPLPPDETPKPEPRASGRWRADERSSAVMLASARVDSPHPTVVVDDQGKVISMNAFAALILGRLDEDVHGIPVEALLGFAVGSPSSTPTNPAPPSGDANAAQSAFAERARRRDGTTFPVEVTCAHFHEQAQRFTIIHFCDVSARHAVATRLRQLSSALEQIAVDTVKRTLATTGLALRLLKIEITESAATSNADAAIAILHALKEIGVELLIDDFGTGYSSLSRLTRFPLNKLKIDRSFVAKIPDSGHDNAVASTIVAMAHSLGLGVIAEGVETQDQAAFLRFIGCEEMQGYLFSKPVAASDFEQLLRSDKRLSIPDAENAPSASSERSPQNN